MGGGLFDVLPSVCTRKLWVRDAELQSAKPRETNMRAKECKESVGCTTHWSMKRAQFIRWLKDMDAPWVFIAKIFVTIFFAYLEFKVAKPAFVNGGKDSMFGLGLTMFLALGVNILWRNELADLLLRPLNSVLTGGDEPVEKKPFYFAAIAKQKRGLYLEALAEVRRQLQKFPNDLEGVLLLASIQAEGLKDIAAAENTLNEFSGRPNTPANQVVVALTHLADWHLKISADVNAARADFENIITRFPNTAASAQAEQRLAHLVDTGKMIVAQQTSQNIILQPGVHNLGLLGQSAFPKAVEIDPTVVATAHREHLAMHPHDTKVREELAVLYAKEFQRLDLATLEIEQLVNEPNHKPKEVAHWLNLLANLQVELGADINVVRATLERIVEGFADLPVAEIAQRRLAVLNNEFRGRQETSVVKLGVYEQNLGLKYGRPTKS